MDRNELKNVIARRVARELHDGDVVNLGIGLPTIVPRFLPDGVNVILHSENGIIGTGSVTDDNSDPLYVTDAGGKPAISGIGGCYVDSCVSFGLIRGGHVDVTVLGALEVDEAGNLASWIIPGKMMPGMGGAMDLAAGAKKIIVAMEHTTKGRAKIMKRCSLPLTAARCVDKIITEMGVFKVLSDGLVLVEISPGYALEDIRTATDADFTVRLPG